MPRKPALRKFTKEEVQRKTAELGSIRKASSFYGCADITIKRKIGDFQYKNTVTNEHVEEIRRMSKTHTRKVIARLLGYTIKQVICAAIKHDISFSGSRKPRSDSGLSYYEMNNMDLIVKQYRTMEECAVDHDVTLRCIQQNVQKCRQARSDDDNRI